MSELKHMFEKGWYEVLEHYLKSPDFRNIGQVLFNLSRQKVELTPKFSDTFRAFRECSWSNLHTVILGMDPYPGKVDNKTYDADGLAFSARNAVKCPKSLQYIFHAIDTSVCNSGGYYPENFDLTRWANQGILLLNCALSLPIGSKAGSHIGLWKPFITKVLTEINNQKSSVAIGLMGNHAKEYKKIFTNNSFVVYSCEHPSAANYHGGKWNHENIFKTISAFHKFNNNIEIKW